MRDEAVDIRYPNLGLLQCTLRGFGHQRDRTRKHLAIVLHRHQKILGARVKGERSVAAAGRFLDQIIAAAIRRKFGGEETTPPVRARRQHDGTRRIGEEHRPRPLGEIDAAAKNIGGDHQRRAVMRAHETVREGKRIEKIRTGTGQIDRAGFSRPSRWANSGAEGGRN